jgi:hypothetical protein
MKSAGVWSPFSNHIRQLDALLNVYIIADLDCNCCLEIWKNAGEIAKYRGGIGVEVSAVHRVHTHGVFGVQWQGVAGALVEHWQWVCRHMGVEGKWG